MKPSRLFNGEHGAVTTYDATQDSKYLGAISTINNLRARMLKDSVLRGPLLDVFHAVYYGETTFSEDLKPRTPDSDVGVSNLNIREFRDRPPSDADVVEFLTESFPDVHLAFNPNDTAANDDCDSVERVFINEELVRLWLLPSPSKSPQAVSQLVLGYVFVALLLHELGRSALLWYGKGGASKPQLIRDAGKYIERRIFGGIAMGEFDPKTMQVVDVGLGKGDGFYPVDLRCANELLKLDTSRGLPCFDISALSPAPTRQGYSRLHAKLLPIKAYVGSGPAPPRPIKGSNIRPFLVNDKKYRMP